MTTTATQPRRLPKALSADELQALRTVPKNARDQALIEVMAGCGLRVSEACNLTLDGVHWSSDTPALRFVGKRAKERVVPMNLEVQDALRSWLEARREGHSEYVFCSLRTGSRLSRKTVWAALKRYARKAGTRHVHPHMLRHSFGTALANREVPVERIRELMGHASIQTSQVYLSVSTEQKRQAVEQIDHRHRASRWLSRQRNRSYRFFGRSTLPQQTFTAPQTVGRQQELRQLQDHVEKGIDTLVLGPVGSGKSHLLELLEGEKIIRIKGLTPARQAIITIAEALYDRGALQIDAPETAETEDNRALSRPEEGEPSPADRETPLAGGERPEPAFEEPEEQEDKGRQASSEMPAAGEASGMDFEEFKKQHTRTSVPGWTQIVLDAVEKDEWILIVDDLADLTASTGRVVDQLAHKFIFIAAMPQVKKQYERHFWKFERIELSNLPAADAHRLIRQASTGIEIEDARMFETHLRQKSAGNPRAILESVARLRKEPAVTRRAVRELSHTGARAQIDLTPAVIIVTLGLVGFRFVARGLDSMEFYLVAGLGSAVAMGIRFFLARSRK